MLAQPKVYAFDTGFICHARRWDSLREDDRGLLWEHLVLETLQSMPAFHDDIRFWRDKDQREVDFVLPRGRETYDVIEAKWSDDAFGQRGLAAFRSAYPKGRNFVVSPRRAAPVTRKQGALEITFAGPIDFVTASSSTS